MLVSCPQISAGSTLTWIGFGENGMLLTMDSAGLFRLHSRMWEGRWTPVLDTAAKAGAGSRSDVYWPVAVADNGVLCAVLKVGVGLGRSIDMATPRWLTLLLRFSHSGR
jgi:chromosome transmission fidelity protein 4